MSTPAWDAVRVHYNGWTCRLVAGRYHDGGRLALDLVDAADGEPVARCTVNVPEIPVNPGEVLIKTYAENRGVLKALVEAGVVEDTGVRHSVGYAEDGVAVARLLIHPPETDDVPRQRQR